MGPEKRGAERCGEDVHPPFKIFLSKAPLSVKFDEISMFALEMAGLGAYTEAKRA